MLLVTSGDIRRRTGGNVYDRRVLRAARTSGLSVAVAAVDTPAMAASAVTRARPRLLVVDSIAFAAAAPALDRTRIPVVALVHMRVSGDAARRVLRRADRVVAVSDALATELRALGAQHVEVVPPGSDGVPALPRPRRGGRARELRALCVANWSRVKGVDVLLDACEREREVRVTLVGTALDRAYARSLRPALARLAARVRVRGALGPVGIARELARADIVVVPSREEAYGIAASEAIAHGVPVVASDLPALRAVVDGAGILVRPSDGRSLARALSTMRVARTRTAYREAAARRARRLPRWSDAERSFVSLLVREMRVRRSGGDEMPPRGVKSPKRKRQYEHIKKSELKRGRSEKSAERIAAATTNKTRRKKGETKSKRSSSRKKKS